MKIYISENQNKQISIANSPVDPRKERLMSNVNSHERALRAEFRQFSSRIISHRIISVIS